MFKRPMLCTQRRKQANSEQSSPGHWELTSSASTTNPGSKCLPEGRSGITKQRLRMRSHQITNQSKTVLIKIVFGFLPKWFSHFCPELFALPQPKFLPYSAPWHQTAFVHVATALPIDSIKIKTGLGYSSTKEHYLPSMQKALGSITSTRKRK